MPIYDFKCRDCGRISEVLLRATDKIVCCPSCGSENMERLVPSSYMVKTNAPAPGTTCCGRDERCATPPCSTGGTCRRDKRS